VKRAGINNKRKHHAAWRKGRRNRWRARGDYYKSAYASVLAGVASSINNGKAVARTREGKRA